jgi:ribonuclease VapC
MILVVDASALVAIALREPERSIFNEQIADAEAVFMTAVNLMEVGLAVVLRQNLFGMDEFAEWIAEFGVVEIPVTGQAALEAYLQFGKGVHRAGLNLGDCFAYALAKQLDAPLLFKGDDFGATDVKRAVQPT